MHLKFLSLPFIFFSSLFTSSLISEVELSEHHLLYQIKKNECFCVEKYIGDKIFLKPENVIFSEDGLLLNLNGSDLALLPLVQRNAQGIFLEADLSVFAKKPKPPLGPCPACGVNTDGDGRCQNSVCPFHRMIVLP